MCFMPHRIILVVYLISGFMKRNGGATESRENGCNRLLWIHEAVASDWRTHSNGRLYNQALTHFCGGELACVRRIELWIGPVRLGKHLVQFDEQRFAFVAIIKLNRDYSNTKTILPAKTPCF